MKDRRSPARSPRRMMLARIAVALGVLTAVSGCVIEPLYPPHYHHYDWR